MAWCGRRFNRHFGDIQSDGTGRIDEFRGRQAQSGMPDGGVDDEDQPLARNIAQPAMRGKGRRQVWAQQPFQRVEPQGTAYRVGGSIGQRGLEGRLGSVGAAWRGLRIRHRNMTFKTIVNNSRARMGNLARTLGWRAHGFAATRPLAAAGWLLGAGLILGVGASQAVGSVRVSLLQAKTEQQQKELEQVRRGAQQEVNALAARLGELQAQANRLNALGERLTRLGQLQDGEFDFAEPVGIGGSDEAMYDMAPRELADGVDQLGRQFEASGQQLSVLETLLFNRELDRNATPSRMPVVDSYITSGFGGRADPFGGGGQYHRGIDFKANVGDPVLSVADGVVSFSGVKGGYGNMVDVDHGNGYVTRYAHNSRLLVKEGDLVRAGQQVAKAGSSGRSTGAHVHFEVWENGRSVNPRKFLGEGPSPVTRPQRG